MENLSTFVKQNLLVPNPPVMQDLFSFLENNDQISKHAPASFVQTGNLSFDALLKNGFRKSRLHCLEICDFLFAGVFFDFLKELTNNGKKICVNISPKNVQKFAEDYCETTLHFSDSLKNPDLFQVTKNEIAFGITEILENAVNENCDFLFICYPYWDFKESAWVSKFANEIKNFDICVFIVNPIPLPIWTHGGGCKTGYAHLDRSNNNTKDSPARYPAASTLANHCDFKILVRPVGALCGGPLKEFLKEKRRHFKKSPVHLIEIEFLFSQQARLAVKSALVLSAMYCKADGLTIDSPPTAC